MPIPDQLDPLQEALATELLREDDLGAVIRSHIHIENIIYQIVDRILPRPDYLKSREDREYSQMVRLALALGVNPELKSILNTLGNLRNDFAHKLDSELTQERTTQLYTCLPSVLKNIIQSQIPHIYPETIYINPPTQFSELSTRRQFALVIITVWCELHQKLLSIPTEGSA